MLLNRCSCAREGGQPVPLHEEFGGSVLWKDMGLWADLFRRLVEARLRSEQEKRRGGRFLGKVFSGVRSAITGREDTEDAALLVG